MVRIGGKQPYMLVFLSRFTLTVFIVGGILSGSFLQNFALPALAGIVAWLVVGSFKQLDLQQRGALVVVVVASAFFIGHTLDKRRTSTASDILVVAPTLSDRSESIIEEEILDVSEYDPSRSVPKDPPSLNFQPNEIRIRYRDTAIALRIFREGDEYKWTLSGHKSRQLDGETLRLASTHFWQRNSLTGGWRGQQDFLVGNGGLGWPDFKGPKSGYPTGPKIFASFLGDGSLKIGDGPNRVGEPQWPPEGDQKNRVWHFSFVLTGIDDDPWPIEMAIKHEFGTHNLWFTENERPSDPDP